MARREWADRPSHAPPTRSENPVARMLRTSPARVLVACLCLMSLSVAVIAWALTDPVGYFNGGQPIGALFGAVTVLLHGSRLLPRVTRAAWRRRRLPARLVMPGSRRAWPSRGRVAGS